MASLDNIFTRSTLTDSQKQAKMIFGRLLIALRKSNKIKLYSLLESVCDHDIENNTLKFTLSDKVSYEMINNRNDLETLQGLIDVIRSGLKLEINCSGKEPFDVYKFEEKLKKEFGKILTIKKD